MHSKEGQPGAAISHESRPGKPSFCTFDIARDYSFSSGTDNSSNNGLGKPMGYYPNYQHAMFSRNEAQQRSGHRPSASQAFHPLLQAQTVVRGTLQPTSAISPVRDLPFGAGYEQAKPAMNPMPANNKGGGSTPAAATPAAARCTWQPTIAISLAPHMHWPARVLPFGAGYEQAKPAMDPQHATTKQIGRASCRERV